MDVRHGRSFKLGRWNGHEKILRDVEPQTFGVKKKENFVPKDRPTQRSCPLIGNRKRSRLAGRVVEPVVGVKDTSVPVVLSVSVELVGARLGNVVDVSTRSSAELPRVASAHYSGFLNLILSQQKNKGADLAEVVRIIIVIHPIHRVQIRETRHPENRKVGTTLNIGVHHYTWSSLYNIGEIVSRIWELADLLLVHCRRDIPILGLDQRGFVRNGYVRPCLRDS